jgi:hypothetical protein
MASLLRNLLRPLVRRLFVLRGWAMERHEAWLKSRRQEKLKLDPSSVTFCDRQGRKRASGRGFRCHQGVAVLLAVGASNLANECDPNGKLQPRRGVYNFNFLDGKCYVARDPLLGTTLDRSNVLTRIGDIMVARKMYDRVLLVPVAHGGTFVKEWAPGGRMCPRLIEAIRQLRLAGIHLTHILWQQGEAEANLSCGENIAAEWMEEFHKIANIIRNEHVDAPIYVAQATICHGGRSEIIRGAQMAVVRPEQGIFAGPDLDVLGAKYRWDGCHFSVSGMDKAADLWLEAIAASKVIAIRGAHRCTLRINLTDAHSRLSLS